MLAHSPGAQKPLGPAQSHRHQVGAGPAPARSSGSPQLGGEEMGLQAAWWGLGAPSPAGWLTGDRGLGGVSGALAEVLATVSPPCYPLPGMGGNSGADIYHQGASVSWSWGGMQADPVPALALCVLAHGEGLRAVLSAPDLPPGEDGVPLLLISKGLGRRGTDLLWRCQFGSWHQFCPCDGDPAPYRSLRAGSSGQR